MAAAMRGLLQSESKRDRRKKYSVDELVKELKKDEMFYEESGGGVTLSGGEVMTADMDYVEELAKKTFPIWNHCND